MLISFITSNYTISSEYELLCISYKSSNFTIPVCIHGSVMHRRGKYVVNGEPDGLCLTCCFCSLQDSDPKDYQMWVRYGKEDSPYPLIGE